MPSDVILTRALEDGTYDVEIVEAERRFWVSYKHVHGIKFQVSPRIRILIFLTFLFADESGSGSV
jgi:hypothetical protein